MSDLLTTVRDTATSHPVAFFIYLLLVNLVAFVLMGMDKSRARRHEWRVPEKTFLWLAVAGGTAGVLLGMRFFRHKTRNRTFSIGGPMLLAAQVAVGLAILSS